MLELLHIWILTPQARLQIDHDVTTRASEGSESSKPPLCTMAPDLLLPSMKQLIKYLANVEITSLVESLAFLRTMEDTQIFVNASALHLDQAWLVYDP